MKITIVYDNQTPAIPNLRKDWGFSALVEVREDLRILFDTGADGAILLDNMRVLGIDPLSIQAVVISHAHHDHTGGLRQLIGLNPLIELWLPPSMPIVTGVMKVSVVRQPTQMYQGVFSTGEIEGIEQTMAVETSKGLVLVAGCSHPRMETILMTAGQFGPIYGIVGGLHGTSPQALNGMRLICATHCTRESDAIKQLYPDAFVEGGAGRVIEVL